MLNPVHVSLSEVRIVAVAAVFAASYLVFAIGNFPGTRIDRTGAAIIGGVLMFALGALRPDAGLRAIDFNTLVLLFAMMLIVAYLRRAGFFDWLTDRVLRRLHPHHLLPTVIFTGGLLSAFFVNDIICLVMVPLVLTATRRLRLPPAPYLLALATASNIGSVASMTGNPQNMVIGSYSHLGYRSFLGHLAPVAVVGLLIDWAVLHRLCARQPGGDPAVTQPLQIPAVDTAALRKPALVAGLVLIGFLAGVPPALTAALGAALLLMTRTVNPAEVYEQVDWGLLVFFVGLFLIVGGAEQAGLMQDLMRLTHGWRIDRPAAFTVITAALSNLVSNVPAVMLLKNVVPTFAHPGTGWLVLAMASTLAGNLTITGSVANIIVVEGARPDVEISFRQYLRVGLPVTVLTLLVGWGWLVLVR